MICTTATDCGNLGTSLPPVTNNVASINSDSTGVITITYQTALLTTGSNTLALVPWDGSAATPAKVDLSTAAGASIIWKCGYQAAAGSTVPAKYLPATCR
jgi:hypothetical protein